MPHLERASGRHLLSVDELVISELTTISVIGVLASVSWLTKRSISGNGRAESDTRT
jgi:hypothetical protein